MDVDPDRLAKALRSMSTRSRFCVSGELRDVVVGILWDFIDRRRRADPLFTVDEYRDDGNGIVRNLAESAELQIALAAYAAACEVHPRGNVHLRSGIRVVRSAREDRAKAAQKAEAEADEKRLNARFAIDD